VSCAASCSACELASPTPNTSIEPTTNAINPATVRAPMRSVSESEAVFTAMTTSVNGFGSIPLPKVRLSTGANGRSPGSRVQHDVSIAQRQMPTFPAYLAVMKAGRFVDKEASTPVDHAATPVASPVRNVGFAENTIVPRHPGLPGPVTFALPLYSRGVGCDKDARIGSIPSHSLLIRKTRLVFWNHSRLN
jgi:hypothetical protein